MNVQYLFIYSIKYNYFSTKKKQYSIHCSIKNFVNQYISIFLIIANIITYSATPFTIHEYRRLYPRFSEPMRRNTPNEVYPTLVDTQVSDGNCNVDTHIYIYTRRNMRNYTYLRDARHPPLQQYAPPKQGVGRVFCFISGAKQFHDADDATCV